MKQLFADSGFWIALLNSRDELHDRAMRIPASLGEIQIVTSEWVLTEVLNCFAERGTFLRAASAAIPRSANHPNLRVVSFAEMTFQQAFELYGSRPD